MTVADKNAISNRLKHIRECVTCKRAINKGTKRCAEGRRLVAATH